MLARDRIGAHAFGLKLRGELRIAMCRVYGVDIPGERKKTEADPIGLRKQAYRERAAPFFETFGPKNDREFEALLAEREGLPA
jgi:hypothetical protein